MTALRIRTSSNRRPLEIVQAKTTATLAREVEEARVIDRFRENLTREMAANDEGRDICALTGGFPT